MIELQTLVGELTIAEFTKLCGMLCGMIGGTMFILCFLVVVAAYLICCIIGCTGYFIAILKKFISIRKKEKQEEEKR